MTIPLESPSIPDPLRAIERNVDQLIEIVDHYDLHVNLDLLHALESLRKRTAAHRLTLAVFGDSRENKSSLIDALLGITLEETSIPPSTATCTYLAYGLQGDCAVTLADNMTAWLPLEQLAGFVTEKVSASNLKKVLVRIPNAALENGLVVIDTPELTDDLEPLLSSTAAAVAEADVCVFIFEPGGESKENVIAFLRRMQGILEKFFFVLKSTASLSGVEQEKSLELARHSLEQRCGLAKPRVVLLSSISPEECDAKLRKERSEVLGFARMSWKRLTSNEVARIAGGILAQADGALNLRETAPLERMRLRRAVKALDGISRQSAELALASDAARRTLLEPPLESATAVPEATPPIVPASDAVAPHAQESQVQDCQRVWEPALTTNVPQIMQMTGTTGTMQTMGMTPTAPSFTGESFAAWIEPPSATPLPVQALCGDTTAPIQSELERPAPTPASAIPRRAVPRIFRPKSESESEPESATGPAREPRFSVPPPNGRSSRQAEIPADRPARSFEWCANRIAWADDQHDDDEFMPGDGVGPLWKVVGFVALLGAVLVIAWAVVIVVRPNYVRPNYVRANLAQLLAWRPAAARPAAPPAQAAASSPATPIAPQPVAPQPVPAQASGGAASNEGVSTPPPAAPSIAEATPGAPAHNARHAPTDAALETALDKWVAASRSGNAQAQAACYAPVVGTYFNSRNVSRQQVQRDKQHDSEAIAGVQNFHITTLGISDQGNGQRSALVEKDWDTPTGGGPAFAGNEIERLVFAQVDGQWKIVGEQEVNLGKLHRTRASRQMAANF